MAKGKKKNSQGELDEQVDEPVLDNDYTDEAVPSTDEDDVKYQIGTIVVDDGSSEEYTELDDDAAVAAPNGSAPVENDDEEGEATEELQVKDEFLDEANADLDDPERYWDS